MFSVIISTSHGMRGAPKLRQRFRGAPHTLRHKAIFKYQSQRLCRLRIVALLLLVVLGKCCHMQAVLY